MSPSVRRALLVALVVALAWLAARMTSGRLGDWAPPASPTEPGTR